jgi:hypothetical protein
MAAVAFGAVVVFELPLGIVLAILLPISVWLAWRADA